MLLVMLITAMSIFTAAAYEPSEVLADPALEARARAMSAELRCMVCQNQSIDQSNAPLAKDLRLLVRDRLLAGDTDEEVMAFVVARYGEFVLLRPRMAPHTYILWFGPFIVLLLAAGLAVRYFAARRKVPVEADGGSLSDEEQTRIDRITSGDTRL